MYGCKRMCSQQRKMSFIHVCDMYTNIGSIQRLLDGLIGGQVYQYILLGAGDNCVLVQHLKVVLVHACSIMPTLHTDSLHAGQIPHYLPKHPNIAQQTACIPQSCGRASLEGQAWFSRGPANARQTSLMCKTRPRPQKHAQQLCSCTQDE
jgi:hypothetical protein